MGGVEMNVGILFADLRGFTSLAEQQAPDAVATLLNRFYATAVDVLCQHAIIDKLVGDQVMALYLPGIFPGEPAELAYLTLRELGPPARNRSAYAARSPLSRARLLAAGAVILELVLSHYGLDEAWVKPNGIRGGLVVSYARYGDEWRQHLPLPPASL